MEWLSLKIPRRQSPSLSGELLLAERDAEANLGHQ
jgi:hypothetical protein